MDWGEYTYAIAFYGTAAVAVASAFMVVWHRNPIINALYLVVAFFAVAVAYVLLNAHFLAAIQILLYAGAILVLFLMIVMLINVNPSDLAARATIGKALGGGAALGIMFLCVTVFMGGYVDKSADGAANPYSLSQKPGMATAEELAAYLISVGATVDSVVTDPSPAAREMFAAGSSSAGPSRVAVAKNVLEGLEDERNMDWVKLPEEFSSIQKLRMEDFRKAALITLAQAQDVDEVKAPVDYQGEFDDKVMSAYLTALVRGRLNQIESFGSTGAVGKVLFTRYILPFEAASFLLLAAIVGVLALARREETGEDS